MKSSLRASSVSISLPRDVLGEGVRVIECGSREVCVRNAFIDVELFHPIDIARSDHPALNRWIEASAKVVSAGERDRQN
jgi:hypothetical protein